MRFYRRNLSLKHNASARHRHLVIFKKVKFKARKHRSIAFFEETRKDKV